MWTEGLSLSYSLSLPLSLSSVRRKNTLANLVSDLVRVHVRRDEEKEKEVAFAVKGKSDF